MLTLNTNPLGKLFFMLIMAWSIGLADSSHAERPDETAKMTSVRGLFGRRMILEWSGKEAGKQPEAAEEGTAKEGTAKEEIAKEQGLVFQVEFEDREYLLGEPVWIRCSLINQSAEPITISYGRFEGNNEILFDIQDAQENQIQRQTYERDTRGPRPLTLEPNHCLIEMFNLTDEYAISQSGEYAISASFHSDGKYSQFDKAAKFLGMTQIAKYQLDQKLKNLRIVDPAQEIDQKALEVIAKDSRGSHRSKSNFPFRYAFAEQSKRDSLIKKHPDSYYTNYARYYDALYKINRFEPIHEQFGKQAVALLEAIDTSDYPKLFQEHVHFHLIEAHLGIGSDKAKTDVLLKSFRDQFPNSPYLSLLTKTE